MYDFPLDSDLARSLIACQFPQWADLPIWPIEQMGHDNRTFHLGDELTVRLPSDPSYVDHIPCEILCLTKLQPYLDVRIPECVGEGKACDLFPAPWTVNRFIPGKTISHDTVPHDKEVQLARDIRHALFQLQAAPTMNAPEAGKHCWYRGCHPSVYEAETLAALEKWKDVLPVAALRSIWDQAMATRYDRDPVWFHGDVAVGNLLVQDGRLCAMIDFGTSAVGDPACDYVMAWTFFSAPAREVFLAGLDEDMILRAKAWAIWKALICFDGAPDSPHLQILQAALEG